MSEILRRRVLASMGSAAVLGTAGCAGLGGSEQPRLNLWAKNNLAQERVYEIDVESVEKTGSLKSGESDTYQDIVKDPGSGGSIYFKVKFGIGTEEDFITKYEVSTVLNVKRNTKAVFAGLTVTGLIYGVTDDPSPS